MLDKNQKVIIKWNGKNRKYYEEKGYVFTGRGDQFEVNVNNISLATRCEVNINCDFCGNFAFTICNKTYNQMRKKHPNKKDVCEECKINNPEAKSIKTKITFEIVMNKFKELNLNLLTTKDEYKNASMNFRYTCPNHEETIQTITWASIKKVKYGCKFCSLEGVVESKRDHHDEIYGNRKLPWELSLDIAKNEFEKRGFLLLETNYKDNQTPMKYICLKHTDKGEQQTSLKTVMQKEKYPYVCKWCHIETVKGEKSHLWKGGLTVKNKIIRESFEMAQWRKSVFERDQYTCQACGDNTGGNLNAHHIENFSENEEKRFDVDNGITLCEKCHDPSFIGSFHYIYGTIKNTREQLEKFIVDKKKGITLHKRERFVSGRSYFSDEEVLTIRNRIINGERTIDIAEDYSVNVDLIYKIKAGRTYRHITNSVSLIKKKEGVNNV